MSFGISHSPSLSKTLVLIITLFPRFLFTFFCLPIKCCLDSISELGFLNWVFRRLQSVAVGCRHDSGDVADFLMDGFRFLFWGFFFVVVGRVVESIFFGGGPGRQPAVGLAVATRVDGFVSSVFIGRTNQPTDRPTNRKETTTMTTTTTTTTTTTKKQKRPNGRRRFLFGRGPWNRFYRVFFSRVLPSFFLLF